ncbi:MAG TPA: MEDS domain-containing protein, partial [Anaeromyxobacter sp.]
MTSLGRSVLVESARDVTSRATTHDHLVQFYESEDFLPGIVSGFLAAGLRARQPVIAISTARHREAFVARLASAGIDAGEATRAGQLALLDADEALAAILVDGAPSWDRFRAVVGGAIE